MPHAFDPPIHLLLADDEEIYLQATAELLREDGFLVDTALDAMEARRLLEAGTYDVLISDIRMPGNLRFEFIRQIGRLAPDLPVILVTAHPTVETATEAVTLPVVAYLTKPLPIEVLIEHVLRCASVVRTRRVVGRYVERLSTWSEDLQQLQEAGAHHHGNPSKRLAQEVLGLALGNMAGMLSDLNSLFKVALGEDPGTLACVSGRCPRLDAYQQVLREGIQVLEGTRNSFKSKELGALRQKLEQQLEA
ncbi:MAG: response regulator [Geothrix sp.]|nr:response regulator [Geothrix sp.]